MNAIVDQARSLSLGRPTASERIVLSCIGLHADKSIPSRISDHFEEYGSTGLRVLSYAARAGAKLSETLTFTNMMATGIPLPTKRTGRGPVLEIHLGIKGKAGLQTGVTKPAESLSNPMWANECVVLQASSATSMMVELVVTTGENVVAGTAKFKVNRAVGRIESPLLDAGGASTGATVSICYQLPNKKEQEGAPEAAP